MATLTRQKIVLAQQDTLLTSTVPQPFPRSIVEQERYLRDHNLLVSTSADNGASTEGHVNGAADAGKNSATAQKMHSIEEILPSESVQEIMPSIAHVQSSCLMILSNLLLSPDSWQATAADQTFSTEPSSSRTQAQPLSELHTLVSNLREQDHDGSMLKIAASSDSSALVVELGKQVQKLANSSRLITLDAELALALVSLLDYLNQLSILPPSSPPPSIPSPAKTWSSTLESPNIFDTLKRSLSELQLERLSRAGSPQLQANRYPTHDAESALLWSRIDANLEYVLSICRHRSETISPTFPPGLEQLPPEYEDEEDYDYETPPKYDDPDSPTVYHDTKDWKSRYSSQEDYHRVTSRPSSEKMRMDLEAVTLAIDRLYDVAPQLHNQRVELKKSKVKEMEKARLSGQAKTSVKGKQKQDDLKDLDNMLELIGRASARKLVDQSVVLDSSLEARLEKARRRDVEKRQDFVVQLAKHSDSGRLHDQEAVLHPPRLRDPEALLSLPEFIREPVPTNALQSNPHAILSLPEFINEPVPESLASRPVDSAMVKNHRGRSMSAPSLSWIFSSVPKSPSPAVVERKSYHRKSRPGTSSGSVSIPSECLGLQYIAEHYENLGHIMVFFNVTGATAGCNLEAEVSPLSGDDELLVVTCGLKATRPVRLPARSILGKKEVKVQRGHFELQLRTIPPVAPEDSEHTALFDAAALVKYSPTSFICSSCSLPLVQSARVTEYKDLPSEHWEELVDAWMCHADQKLHDQVIKYATNGFWPKDGQALVGGSYIMFENRSVMEGNLRPVDTTKEEWKSVRCICGAIVGRCQKAPLENGADPMVYRLAKYAIRPVSPTAEPLRLPLSMFIVEDMQEYVHAHAKYRFVLHDEEEDQPRILIWLFKPNIRIAYASPTSRSMEQSGCINAAKVLFKLLGPCPDLDAVLSKYPGFPQAEHLWYPARICNRLAGLLRESNMVYPESMRMMTELEVGFLQRV